MTSGQQTVLAHGLGGSTDLPVPLGYALVGAAWALTFTFAVVALAWRKPRFDPAKPGVPLPDWVTRVADAAITRWSVAVAAMAFTAWVVVAGLTWGAGRINDNETPIDAEAEDRPKVQA